MVFYASPGDRTPCVVVDWDGEDLRKSRFAVLLRRPSFSSLLLDAWAAFAFKSSLSVILRSLNVSASPWNGREWFKNKKIRLFLTNGEVSCAFLCIALCVQRCCAGDRKWNAGAVDDRLRARTKNPKPLPMDNGRGSNKRAKCKKKNQSSINLLIFGLGYVCHSAATG